MSADQLTIRCTCGQTLSVAASSGGEVVTCPSCSTKLRVPATSASNPSAASAPAQNAMGFDSTPNPTSPPTNPYAPSTAGGFPPPGTGVSNADEEAIRNQYLSHEASLKSIGLLYYLGVIFIIPISLFVVVAGFSAMAQGADPAVGPVTIVLGLFYGAIGVLQYFLARGIRRLQNWARITIGVLSVPGLLGFPIGTLISAYFLYLCFSEKGKYVCTPQYQQIVANTPHIKYKTSIVVWIFLGLLVLLIGIGIVAAIAGA